ncbi:GNAT family N-acetyltransferase [Haloferacaceae archaeon DSL9]
MEFRILGWPDDGVSIRLDFRRFSYAGKFSVGGSGKAVVVDPDAALPPAPEVSADVEVDLDDEAFDTDVLAAISFGEDRTDPETLWLRYVTVRADRRGEGLGSRLAAFTAARALDRGYRRLRIAVNNPFSYHALYKAGFGFTGRQTGLAELVLERPGPRDADTYQAGLDVFRGRAAELSDAERSFLDAKDAVEPPEQLPVSES